MDALLKQGIIHYVPREKVFEIQLKYLEEKEILERTNIINNHT